MIGASKRRTPRNSLFLSATMIVQGARAPVIVRVRNLSEGGMMVDSHASFAVGQAVEADLRGIGTIGGRIAWTEAGRAGVAFDYSIDPKLARAQPRLVPDNVHNQIVKAPAIYEGRPGLRARD
jgi:hypothetical protein